MIFDTHAHYLSERFDEDREEVLARLLSPGSEVGRIIECADDKRTVEEAVRLSEKYEGIYCAIGVHPHNADEYDPALEARIEELAPKAVAIGEIGLDYHYDFHPRELQREVLEKQLLLAQRLDKPVVLHSRESTQDMLGMLRSCGTHNGVMHCFSGSTETAKILLDMGLYLGVGGTLTFKGAVKAAEVVRMMPTDRLLLETDSPYLAPVPHRGERNDSSLIAEAARTVAEIKGMTYAAVLEAAWENAERLFLKNK